MTRRTLAALVALALFPAAAQAQDVELMCTGKVVKKDATWFIPMNRSYNKVALFSYFPERFSFYNKSGDTLVVNKVTIKRAADVIGEEFALQDDTIQRKPLVAKDVKVAPKKAFGFNVRFYPVRSGARKATITITYNTSKTFTFEVRGHGRNKAQFFSQGKLAWHKILGGVKSDATVGGMVADKAGNCYLTANANQMADRFAFDLLIAKVTPEGKLGWSKLWFGPYRDYQPDSGQNAETGGTSNVLAFDAAGFLYVVGAVSEKKSNNTFKTLILKLNPKDGSIVWEKLWSHDWSLTGMARQNDQAYGMDVRKGTIYITGQTHAGAFLLSLSCKDGSVNYAKAVDAWKGYVDRGHVVKVDSKGNAFIGGSGNGKALLIKVSGADTKTPKLAWAKRVHIGWGSNINGLDIDASDHLYVSCDRRGAKTFFSVLKLDGDANVVWGKTYKGNYGDKNNTAVVRVIGGSVYAGGRIGLKGFDTQAGDGFVMKLAAQDGKLQWSTFHYSGKGPDELAEHRVKGIALVGKALYVAGQVYTGTKNGVRYYGYWYDGTSMLVNYTPKTSDLVRKDGAAWVDLPKGGETRDAKKHRKYIDAPQGCVFQDASQKKDGVPPDADCFLMRIDLK